MNDVCALAGRVDPAWRLAYNHAPAKYKKAGAMTYARSSFATVLASSLLAAAPALAHHSPAAFDMQRQVTIAGTVASFEWANPHTYVTVENEADGRMWVIELVSPSALRQYGWSSATLAKGDRVTVTASPSRNAASSTAFLQSIEKSGTVLYANPRPGAGPPGGPGPTTAAGSAQASSAGPRGAPPPNAGPPGAPPSGAAGGQRPGGAPAFRAQSLAGTWATLPGPALPQLLNDSFKLPTTPRGAAAISSFTDAAANPGRDCVPYGVPIYMILPIYRSIEVARDAIAIRGEESAIDRTVHMNRATHAGAAESLLGDSIGRWEGEALVVDTALFAEHAMGNAGGLPSSTRKHLVERFELTPDRAALTYTFTLEDPEYLTAPVQGMARWAYRPDVAFAPIACNLENARKFLQD
jgi:hypothetical protein